MHHDIPDVDQPEAGPTRPSERTLRERFVLGLLIAVVGAVVVVTHYRALSARAISFDDHAYLVTNDLVQNPSFSSVGRFFSEMLEPSTVGGYYQPLAMASLMLDCAVGGGPEHLRPIHRTSLALHVMNTALIIVLLYALFGRPAVAGLVGLLFGVHPMTVETIAWVGERKTVLATFFTLCCLLSYVRFARGGTWPPKAAAMPPGSVGLPLRGARARYGRCLTFFALALLSKPTTTPLPVLLLLLDVWPLQRFSRRAVIEKLPFLALASASAVVTVISQGRTAEITMPHQYGPLELPLLVCHNLAFYALKMIRPSPLSSIYPFPERLGLSDPLVLGGLAILALVAVAASASRAWRRPMLVGGLFFLAALAPTLVNVGYSLGIAADKYVYMPSLGLLLVLAWAGGPLLQSRVRQEAVSPDTRAFAETDAPPRRGPLPYGRGAEAHGRGSEAHGRGAEAHGRGSEAHGRGSQGGSQSVGRVIVLLLVISLAGLEARATRRYLVCWRDTVSLYEHILTVAPGAAEPHNNLGYALNELGRHAEAMEHLGAALRIKGGYVEAYINRARAHEGLGQYDRAVADYAEALNRQPGRAEVYNDRGKALFQLRRYDEAAADFNRATAIDAKLGAAHRNLGMVLMVQGKEEQAVDAFRRALPLLGPDEMVHSNLAALLSRLGRQEEAIAECHQALAIKSDSVEAHVNLALALAATGRHDEAIDAYRTAVRFDPENASLRFNLGTFLGQMGRWQEAAEAFEEVLRLDPAHAQAREALRAVGARLQRASPPGSRRSVAANDRAG